MTDCVDATVPVPSTAPPGAATSVVPRSIKVVGGLGILFGCLGILSASHQIMLPRMMQMQKQNLAMMRAMKPPGQGDAPFPPPELVKWIAVPDWYESWDVPIALASLAVAAFYLFAAIRLFQFAPGAVRIFCLALAIAIVAAVAKGSIAYAAGGLIAIWGVGGCTFSVVVNSVLALVIAITDRSANNRFA